MVSIQQSVVRITANQKIGLLVPYVKKRIKAQIQAVALIVIYLICFQTLVLNIAISEAAVVATGIAAVVLGLAFFMEGLFLGLMPLGEVIGIKLPQKTKLPIILTFAFILGLSATFAEPAIGILKTAGAYVKAWDAPLLFLVLNKYSNYLVYSVGVGVGIAVLFGMLRFLYGWSLKPFIYILVSILSAFSFWALFQPNMKFLIGLAWDCGAVTTGPVTVPLVLALGIGICRVVSSGTSESTGFGVVTLASLFPILAVLSLGALYLNHVPQPMEEARFFAKENQSKALKLFNDKNEMIGYALLNAHPDSQMALFDSNQEKILEFIGRLKKDSILRKAVLGKRDIEHLKNWAIQKGTESQVLAIFSEPNALKEAVKNYSGVKNIKTSPVDVLLRNGKAAVQAIIPLAIFFFLVLFLVLREKLPRPDEIILGIFLAVVGMGLLNVGIELGLSKLGNSVGTNIPYSFKKIPLINERQTIINFNRDIVQTAIKPDGKNELFFFANINDEYVPILFDQSAYDPSSKQYIYTPTRGPLFGGENGMLGFLVVLLFAFIMGYGATLAEPALNALGLKVEEITVGTFKKSLLMQAVASGVGLGMLLGVVKIIWDVPLVYLLIPPYLLLLLITKISTEEFVNIAWDSAGVTTGPITVPLVLAIGLGIGNQVNVVEGFGILSLASVCPILAVLTVGLYVNKKRKAMRQESA
ncbi:MAG: DUF1538 domain-containing protein [Deltaproteobacteria bacterium]|nr:DUF1538 domain-containing protein [Deltaproteobacteria bacterium]